MNDSKILSRPALIKIVRRLQKNKKKVVFTNGCFDLLHAGHVRYLRKARGLGDALVVGVNTDASVRALKGRGRPLIPLKYRLEMLSALECVDYLVAFGEETPERLVVSLLPDILVKGADYKASEIVGAKAVLAAGGRVARIALVGGLSTSALVEKIKHG